MKFKYYICALFFFFPVLTRANTPIILSDSVQSFLFRGEFLDYLEDPSNNLTIQDIIHKAPNDFYKGKAAQIESNTQTKSAYWIRLTLINNATIRRNWVIELYDYKIDYFEAYIPNENGQYEKFTGGALSQFDTKAYQHKNFIFDLYDLSGGPKTIYFKIKSDNRIVFFGVVRTFQVLLGYATLEYFLLSIFYGVVLAMIIYNFFLFISTFDKAYFYFVLYVTSIGFLALTKDGIGFQYIWPSHPSWNNIIPMCASYSMICWALIYARAFLNSEKYLPILDKGVIVLLVARTIVFSISFYYPHLTYIAWLDMVPLIYIYALGIVSWSYGYRMARYYVLAFTLFFTGYALSVLNEFQVIHSHPLIVYGFNLGVMLEMLLLSLALADRIKILTAENEKAQRKVIAQSRENEILKDKINRDLESMVQERTQELEEKNIELDTFVYRSSHDIKGPLKSIIGLTKIGLIDVKDETAQNYFDHILKSSKKLDKVVDHLLKVMETKKSKINIDKINLELLLSLIFSSLEQTPFFSHVQKEVKIEQSEAFYSDGQLLFSIIQNLVENAIKYRDPAKDNCCILKIAICVSCDYATIEIRDNGLGIETKLQEKIFDMFYKVNPESSGSGLGLYMTKIYVKKLQGTLVMESETGKGTCFQIKLKNLQ